MDDLTEPKAALRHYLQAGRDALLWKIDRPSSRLVRDRTETCDGIIDLYQRVWAFADATIEDLPLDAVGRLPWWRDSAPGHSATRHSARPSATSDTVTSSANRSTVRSHASESPNIPEQHDWAAYVAELTALAQRF